jgi:hypothetical protein
VIQNASEQQNALELPIQSETEANINGGNPVIFDVRALKCQYVLRPLVLVLSPQDGTRTRFPCDERTNL